MFRQAQYDHAQFGRDILSKIEVLAYWYKNLKSKGALIVIFLLLISYNAAAQSAGEKHEQNQTVTYDEAIAFYSELDKKYNQAKLSSYGNTDIGKPLHLFVISAENDFDPASLKNKNKRIILINNGIHPGEPDGIDACIKLSEDLLTKPELKQHLENTVICIIPVYNVDGALNRGCCSRVNQNGPEEYGFRGNARNLDLNRDFIKCDSENAKTFTKIFHLWQPDVFVDTHVSNGADYQYVMTLISTQHNKLHPLLGRYLHNELEPLLYKYMQTKGFPMVPYVNTLKEIPDSGIVGYMETPRYSTGYTTLFNTIGFVTETHMLKPYRERVEATHTFLHSLIEIINREHLKISELKKRASFDVIQKERFPLSWKLDSTNVDTINFRGFEAEYKKSNISGLQRLSYNQNRPFEKPIPFYNTYVAAESVPKPHAYIIPQAWKEVIELLELNNIKTERITSDTSLSAEVYYITDYKTIERPFESHYLHYNIKTRSEPQQLKFYKGDYIVKVNQPGNRYIVETLEPSATDSYFAWNFFDEILQQKEWFSDYVFEEKAEELLNQNQQLKAEFEKKKSEDSKFASNHFAQLYYIYQRSPYYEKSHMRYPVVRIMNSW